ncbi:uncharacterized protein LOC113147044 [Cyclospora cayetanensis]|uniref:Uncharacterized protein LOC113147044 n=1 Tax=Cyclospora cayetanensis TaxID=88456 RepID=A0A6P6RXY1_9EIME|nr:uncharacterized protein LOC113147044 [Cyclospora cayetanensis]
MGAALSKDSVDDRVSMGWNYCSHMWQKWLHPTLHYGMVPLIFAVGLAANGELTANPLTLFQKLILN